MQLLILVRLQKIYLLQVFEMQSILRRLKSWIQLGLVFFEMHLHLSKTDFGKALSTNYMPANQAQRLPTWKRYDSGKEHLKNEDFTSSKLYQTSRIQVAQ